MIPLALLIVLVAICVALFFFIFYLIFIEQTFYRSIGALILTFLNVFVCYITGLSFFSVDLYGHDSAGLLVHNYIYDLDVLGVIFWGLAWISVILLFQSLYLLYDKPWKSTNKVEGNPYVYYKNPWEGSYE